jgi:hypothetical protein
VAAIQGQRTAPTSHAVVTVASSSSAAGSPQQSGAIVINQPITVYGLTEAAVVPAIRREIRQSHAEIVRLARAARR